LCRDGVEWEVLAISVSVISPEGKDEICRDEEENQRDESWDEQGLYDLADVLVGMSLEIIGGSDTLMTETMVPIVAARRI
jgi:hypothetical protein